MADLGADRLEISLLGELALRRARETLALPASRKTRALLVYLLLAEGPQRRERLCELFFDIPDDPRAALRWSLTKIRGLLGDRAALLSTTGDAVALDASGFALDADRLRGDPARAEVELALESPLAGLDLSQLESYSAWLGVERARIDRLRGEWLARAAESERFSAAERHRFHVEAEALGVAEIRPEPPPPPAERATPRHRYQQQVRYCIADDGARIAYAVTGEGPPLVKTANWLNHLELDWNSPLWGELFETISEHNSFIRYDERGNGLSQWDVDDLSFEAFVRDLETVVDTIGLKRFPLFGVSQGCAVSIEYAARHPERVSKLILLGGYASGWRHWSTPFDAEEREAVITLVEHGWGQDSPIYRQIFSQTFMPSATAEEIGWFNDFQRRTASAANAVRFLRVFAEIDVRHRLAEVRAPTLVVHARDDGRVPIAHGIELAARIPGASLVTLDTDSHLMLGRDPATGRLLAAVEAFLKS